MMQNKNTDSPQSQGRVFIFSAPSGSGKTTIVRHLLAKYPYLGFSISACTRTARPHEQNRRDYYFLSVEEFKEKITQNAFVEWEQVYENTFYGTLKAEVERLWQTGKHVVFDVDVKGGLKLKEYFGERALSVFVTVSSVEVVRQRLEARKTETPESLKKRLDKFNYESQFEPQFDVSLLNDDLAAALAGGEALIEEFLTKTEA